MSERTDAVTCALLTAAAKNALVRIEAVGGLLQAEQFDEAAVIAMQGQALDGVAELLRNALPAELTPGHDPACTCWQCGQAWLEANLTGKERGERDEPNA